MPADNDQLKAVDFSDITFGVDDQGGYVSHPAYGRYQIALELLPPLLASVSWMRGQAARTPLLVVQDPNTGLVTGVFRAPDADSHDKAKERLMAGRQLRAVEQHYALHSEAHEIVAHCPPA